MSAPESTKDELEQVAEADELELTAGGRTDTIWSSALATTSTFALIAAATEPGSAAQSRRTKATSAPAVSRRDVQFVETADANDAVDAEYRSKYENYGGRYVDPMVTPEARATTLRVVPVLACREHGLRDPAWTRLALPRSRS